jgi:predicted TIM-barrel fold metal-dependent hydrolase
VWDPLWAAAQAHNLPLSLHILTGRKGSGIGASVMKSYPSLPHSIERSLSDLIFGGVLERFPKLQLVSAENDIGWIGHYLQRMDHAYEKYQYLEKTTVIPEPPSFYFKRQVHATFQDDRIGVLTREYAGVDNLMWASDFPHSDSTWPRSKEVIARDFAGVPDNETQKIIADNCAALYGIG